MVWVKFFTHNNSINDVYWVEKLGYNLLSVSQLCLMGYNCLFTNEGVTVTRREDSSIAFTSLLKGKVYIIDEQRFCFLRSELNILDSRNLA